MPLTRSTSGSQMKNSARYRQLPQRARTQRNLHNQTGSAFVDGMLVEVRCSPFSNAPVRKGYISNSGDEETRHARQNGLEHTCRSACARS